MGSKLLEKSKFRVLIYSRGGNTHWTGGDPFIVFMANILNAYEIKKLQIVLAFQILIILKSEEHGSEETDHEDRMFEIYHGQDGKVSEILKNGAWRGSVGSFVHRTRGKPSCR